MKSLLINPVLNKEFKLRFRSLRTFMGLLSYLIAMGLVVIGFIIIEMIANGGGGYFRPSQSRTMFMVLSYLQFFLILFITPGLTAGVISGERERQTLNIMLTTVQSSSSIIISKLISSISYLILLIFASLPLYSFVFLFGGVSPATVAKVMGFYLFATLAFGSIGVLCSTLIRRTIVSVITTYGITLFLTGGTAFLFSISMVYTQSGVNLANPLSPVPYFFAMMNPIIVFTGLFDPEFHRVMTNQMGISFPLLWSFVIVYSLITAGALLYSIKKLRPGGKKKSRRKG
ncbi:MAG TPA: ABC transporter permease [Bacillaceae bacterium]